MVEVGKDNGIAGLKLRQMNEEKAMFRNMLDFFSGGKDGTEDFETETVITPEARELCGAGWAVMMKGLGVEYPMPHHQKYCVMDFDGIDLYLSVPGSLCDAGGQHETVAFRGQ